MLFRNSNSKIKITAEMMHSVSTSSKLSLKMSCIAMSGGDIDKAERIYEFFAKDMTLPDVDPTPPSTFQQVKDTASSVFGWLKDNKDEVSQALSFLHALRTKQPITTPSAPLDLPSVK